MKKIFLTILTLFPVMAFCQSGEFSLKSNITGVNPAGKAYLMYRAADQQVIDSAKIENGRFEFRGKINGYTGAIIVIDHKGIGLDNLKKQRAVDIKGFLLEPGNLILKTADSISKAKITGSKINAEYEIFQSLIKPVNEKLIAINQQFATASNDQKKSLEFRKEIQAQTEIAEKERKALAKKFIEENPDSYVAIEALKLFGGHSPDVKEIDPLFSGLSIVVKESEPGKAYSEILKRLKSTTIGSIAPEFTQNDSNGQPVKLSDYRGKYVLIDFWASWCGPCRGENPNVVKNYKKYKDHNFTVLGVSLDKDKQKWLDAIKHDNLEWTQVSDLQHFKNAVAIQYNVNAIPQNILIDPEGRIIAVNLRGVDLGNKLNEILKD